MSIWKVLFGSKKKANSDHLIDSVISQRGTEGLNTPLRPDMALFFKAKEDQWHPTDNPSGKFPLNVAENNLSWDIMEDKIQEVFSSYSQFPQWVSGYTDMTGDASFRHTLADFLSLHLFKIEVNPNHIMTAAGATAVIELAAWILCDEGDTAALPAPCYPVYTQDIFNKAKVKRYDIVTHHDLDSFAHGHPLTISHLDDAHRAIHQRGDTMKMLILSTPDNPTGTIYDIQFLSDAAQWCHDRKIHLLVNELYGLSLIDVNHATVSMDYADKSPFVSFAQVMDQMNSDYLHLAYGLSKDFGMSGFRVGLLYSQNDDLKSAWDNLGAPHLVSNLTQWLMTEVLKDQQFVSSYIQINQKRLTNNYAIVTQTLKKLNIPYAPARGSLFVWIDLSDLMTSQSAEAEHTIWQQLYDDTGILLTPGTGFGHIKYGQFRIVHPFIPADMLEAAMVKFEIFVNTKKNKA